MKFSLPVSSLRKALDLVVSVVDKTAALPITSNILLTIHNNQLSVSATNLQVEMTARQILTYELPDIRCTLPGIKLYDLSTKIPEDALFDCTYESGSAVFDFNAGKFSGSLSVLPADSFPLMENAITQPSLSFQLSADALLVLIEKVHYAMAHQDVRYYLNGLCFDLAEGTDSLTVVGTDGHRLAVNVAHEDITIKQTGKCIVPRRGVTELIRLLTKNNTQTVDFLATTSNLAVKIGNVDFYCKLIEGEYPNYQAAIPQSTQNKILLDTKQCIQAIERTLTLCNEKPRGMRLSFETDKLILQANNSLGEKAYDEVPASYTGTSCTMGFNADYLLASLRKVNTKQVQISFVDNSESAKIEEVDGDESVAVIMPMRV